MLTLAAAKITSFQAIVLGLLQGVTELFPVSSLGHTVLYPHLFGWNNIVAWESQSESPWLAFVVMLHVGSAIGLMAYFWRDWVAIIRAFYSSVRRGSIQTPTERLAWLIITATIPVGFLGLVLEHPLRLALSKPLTASIFLMANGAMLLGAERYRRRAAVRELALREGANADGARRLDTLEYKEAALIGLAQSGALIPGMSRDGICMTAGLARGLNNGESARFAFLLATPPILAAGLLKIGDLTGPNGDGVRGPAFLAAVMAAFAAVLSVRFLTRYFKTRSLTPFGIYCLLFGIAMTVTNA
jgi:undecaprenyl-diphosphatase